MVTTDPIADYLTRLRNAIKARHRVVEIPASNMKKEITKVLYDKGYIQSYKFVEEGPQGTIKIALKSNPCFKARFTEIRRSRCYSSCIKWSWNCYFVNLKRHYH